MSLPLNQIDISVFGSGNWSDQPGELIRRSHRQVEGGFAQVAPAESPNMANMDFVERAIGKRAGSASLESLASVMVASEIIVKRHTWVAPGTTTEIEIAVGKKSIYTNQSGSWAQINDSASAAYTHDSDVTKCSFVEGDGHLFILCDGANNEIQVYRSGADLDPQMATGNNYTEAKGGGTQAITGTWGKGYYIGFWLHGRLCFGNGDSILEYSDVGQPWDLTGGGFYQAKSNIVAGITVVPNGASELNAVGFLSTTSGPEFVPGFDLTDTPKPMQGGGTALNHQVIATIDNWIVYMTKEGGIEGVNYGQTIDLGRRFKTLDGVTGPLDTFDASNSAHSTLPFVFYNREKKQLQWYYPDASQTTISHAVVLDFYLGEPVYGETLEEYEKRVRCLNWSMKEPASNPWFVTVNAKRGAVVGTLATGVCYTMESGDNDLGTIPVLENWEWGDFNGGAPGRVINWRKLSGQFKERGNWNLKVRKFLDRSSGQTGSDVNWSMLKSGAVYDTDVYDAAVYASGGLIRQSTWLEAYSSELRVGLQNQNANEDWVMTNLTLLYQVGAAQD